MASYLCPSQGNNYWAGLPSGCYQQQEYFWVSVVAPEVIFEQLQFGGLCWFLFVNYYDFNMVRDHI